jgi:hypothetical protein
VDSGNIEGWQRKRIRFRRKLSSCKKSSVLKSRGWSSEVNCS